MIAWRAKLRPFLCPGGVVAEERPLQSSSPDIQMCQSAVDLTAVGVRRRRDFCRIFKNGHGASNRTACPPHFLTTAEQQHFESDFRQTVASLRAEFNSLLTQLPDEVVAADLCASFEAAKTKEAVVQCVLALRDLVGSLSAAPQAGED